MSAWILDLPQIERALEGLDLLPLIEEGFLAYSEGRAVVPPVGELILDEGEVHIKYGFIRGGRFYVIKLASGFYSNPSRGLPSGDGMMLLFEQATGRPVAALLDQGRLTDLRTAVAGAIAARYLAPSRVQRIGVAGTGVQARLQVQHLKPITPCLRLHRRRRPGHPDRDSGRAGRRRDARSLTPGIAHLAPRVLGSWPPDGRRGISFR